MQAKQIRINGRIATLRTARKAHKCDGCGLPIEPYKEYYEVVYAGSGLGSLKFPEHYHTICFQEA